MRHPERSFGLAMGLALLLGLAPVTAYAVDNPPVEMTESARESEEDELEFEEGEEPESLKGLEGNSFRFHNGMPVESGFGATGDGGLGEAEDPDELVAQADEAWKKNAEGKYVSSNGKVVEGVVRRGIDVSEWQDTIDWEKAKADDISFAIIRCGGTFYRSRKQYSDAQYERNAAECERLGIPYGVYFFSTAYTVEEARKEADYTIEKLQGKDPTLPIYYDLEYEDAAAQVSPAQWAALTKAFCDRIEEAGYTAGVYASLYWWEHYLTDPVFENWTRWVAQYYSRCQYTGSYDIWQCTGTGRVAGINGSVDINLDFGVSQSEPASDDESNVITRLAGKDAVETMSTIVKEGWESSDAVVVATKTGYWDALAASSLAGKVDAPVIITGKDSLDEVAADEIERLGATTAYVVGGKAALSEAVESDLKEAGIERVVRVAGKDAQETARKIAEKLREDDEAEAAKETDSTTDASSASDAGSATDANSASDAGSATDANSASDAGSAADANSASDADSATDLEASAETKGGACFVATANGYWDALSASPIAYAQGMPIFLTNGSTKLLDAETVAAIKDAAFDQVVILGGESAVPAAVVDQLAEIGLSGDAVVRKAGDDAIKTSTAVAEYALTLGMDADGVGIATGGGYWDALTGGAFCGRNAAPLILVNSRNRSSFDDFVKPHLADIKEGYVFGGSAAVTHLTFNALVEITG